MIFVLAPTQDVFDSVCRTEWHVDPKEDDFFVMTNSLQFKRASRGKMWSEGDEMRMIAPGLIDPEVFATALQIFAPMGAPEPTLDFLRAHVPKDKE